MAELHDGVPLTELGVITRWSLAVRQSEAERADLIAELRADLAWLEKTSTRPSAQRQAADEVPDDTVDRPVSTPLRRLPKPVETATPSTPGKLAPTRSAAPAKSAPTRAAPTKSAPTKAAPSRIAPGRSAPRKTAEAAPSKAAAPRGRRPAAGE